MDKMPEVIKPTFETTNYKNEYYNRVLMLPSDTIEGARVTTKANDLYRKYLGEPDDKKAQELKDAVAEEASNYDLVLGDPSVDLEEQQRALMLQAHTMHLWSKMKI